MIDSHCHLDQPPLYENINEVIVRSKNVGITKILTICTNLESFENIKKIINIDPIIYGTFGIHPHEADKNLVSKTEIIHNTGYSKKIIGIGETGLDFYYNNSDKNNQIKKFYKSYRCMFGNQPTSYSALQKCGGETFDILNNYKNTNLKILMHCFYRIYILQKNYLN